MDPGSKPATLEKVEVTGSSIRRADAETALPVTVISRDEITRSGLTTAAEVLARLSSNPGSAYQDVQSADGVYPGYAGVSLRGLGEGTTLVLLNGRRLANFAFNGTGTDLNSIPLAAIERIEVLKDGASAIYGSDAIGGVINFILRRNWRGVEASVTDAFTEHRGGNSRRATLSAGFGSLEEDRYNAIVSADLSRQNALHASQREFGKTGYRPSIGLDTTSYLGTFPANIFVLDGNGNLAGITNPAPSCGKNGIREGTQCNFDEAAVRDLIPKSTRAGLYGRATMRLDGDTRAFVEGLYTHNQLTSVDSPPNVSLYYLATNGVPPIVVEGSPNYPAGFQGQGYVPIGFRAVPAGNRVDTATTQAGRLLAGVEGSALAWDYSAAVQRSESRATDHFDNGFLSFSRFQPAFDGGVINPFGDSGAAGDQAYASAQSRGDIRRSKATSTGFDAKVSRELLDLTGGPLAIALGIEGRRETFADLFNPEFATDTIGFGSTPSTAGARKAYAAFGELSVPFAKGWEADIAFRYDHYSDVGSTTNPKASLRWAPDKVWVFRGSAGTGFRAPSLRELFTPNISTTTSQPQSDPARCSATGLVSDCNTFFLATAGGNPNLKPEKSAQYSLGFVFEPNRDWTTSVDYWRIKKRNDVFLVLDPTIFSNYASFDAIGSITRGPVQAAYPNLPGPITNIAMGYYNFGDVTTDGIDIDTRYKLRISPEQQILIALRGTRALRFDRDRGAVTTSSLGRADNGPPIQRWRHSLTADWTFGPWAATIANNYVSGYRDEQLDADGQARQVASYTTFDLQAAYRFATEWRVSLGIRNVLDRDPPASNQVTTPQAGYDSRYTDPRGRSFYATLTYAR